MKTERKGIKVEVTFTEGYEKRFTLACINQIKKRIKAETEHECNEK